MDRYEQVSVVGEGSYGLVMKCRHRDTDQFVAIKKFLETEEDAAVRRMALREIRMLKKLRHENLVTMIEVFRHRKRFYLVFEFLDGTILDELERHPGGLGDEPSRERIFQVLRAIQYCHANQIIHRDVKPENVLVSSMGVVKLCDFGFARTVGQNGEACTEYVATRWYRAPELLVGDHQYSYAVDIWAIGCLFAEMMTGDPLFPGESDIDQLYLIVKLVGKPCLRHQQVITKSQSLRSAMRSAAQDSSGFYREFPNWPRPALDFLALSMQMDPLARPTAEDLLAHNYFAHDLFVSRFLPLVRERVNTEFQQNPLLRKYRVEVLMASDKKDESLKMRRPPEPDVTLSSRWRTNIQEGSVKRKYSFGESLTPHNNNNNTTMPADTKFKDVFTMQPAPDDSQSTLMKLAQFNIMKSDLPNFLKQPATTETKQFEALSEPLITSKQPYQGPRSDYLEKTLGNLGKAMRESTQQSFQQNVATSREPDKSVVSPEKLFHSLQKHLTSQTERNNNVPTNNSQILQPNIHNISFNPAPGLKPGDANSTGYSLLNSKKSPSLLQSIAALKSNPHTFQFASRGPQLLPAQPPPRKGPDQTVPLDLNAGLHHQHHHHPQHIQAPSSLTILPNRRKDTFNSFFANSSIINQTLNNVNGNNGNNNNNNNKSKMPEMFSLPVLPGASTSPVGKPKKTKPIIPNSLTSHAITPRILSPTAQTSTINTSNKLQTNSNNNNVNLNNNSNLPQM